MALRSFISLTLIRMDQYLTMIRTIMQLSLSSPAKLYKVANAEGKAYSFQQIKYWLAKQESYALHRPVSKKFDRNTIVTSGLPIYRLLDFQDEGITGTFYQEPKQNGVC